MEVRYLVVRFIIPGRVAGVANQIVEFTTDDPGNKDPFLLQTCLASFDKYLAANKGETDLSFT